MEAVLVINQINLYIIERPGFGLSTPHPNRNYQTWGDDIRQFIEGVIKQQAAVIGYSAGGPYAIACGKYLPELITKVFIISSPSPPETKKLYSEMDWMSKIGYFLARNWKWGLEKAVETEANKWIKNPVKQTKEFLIQGGSLGDAQTFLLNPSIHRAFVLSVMEQYSRGRVGIVTESHDYYLFSRPWGYHLSELSTDIQYYLWYGSEDTGVVPSMGHYLSQHIPNCKSFFLEQKGHLLFFEIWPNIISLISDKIIIINNNNNNNNNNENNNDIELDQSN